MPEIKSKKGAILAEPLSERLMLAISAEITGYTCQFIYGRTADIDYETIVVPTYKMTLENKGKIIKQFNVTRDSWYSRGVIDNGWINDEIELTNRFFEPRDEDVNLYTGLAQYYTNTNEEAYALTQYGSIEIKAEAHEVKQNTYVDNGTIDDGREDLGIAKSVMLHISGWYNNGYKDKMGGSYGCIGFIASNQIVSTESEAEKIRKGKKYEKFETSNEEYKKFIKSVVSNGGLGKVLIKVEKRINVKKYIVLTWQ